jgi:hypothetical protein
MKKFIFKLLDAVEEILTYFTLCVYFLLALIITEAVPSLFGVCIIAAFVIYLLEHHKTKTKKEKEVEES